MDRHRLIHAALVSLSGTVSRARAGVAEGRARLARHLGLATRDELEAVSTRADLLEGRLAALSADVADWSIWGRGTRPPHYDGSEGELYNLAEDPLQRRNLWSDPGRRRQRDELLEELRAHTPPLGDPPLPVVSPT